MAVGVATYAAVALRWLAEATDSERPAGAVCRLRPTRRRRRVARIGGGGWDRNGCRAKVGARCAARGGASTAGPTPRSPRTRPSTPSPRGSSSSPAGRRARGRGQQAGRRRSRVAPAPRVRVAEEPANDDDQPVHAAVVEERVGWHLILSGDLVAAADHLSEAERLALDLADHERSTVLAGVDTSRAYADGAAGAISDGLAAAEDAIGEAVDAGATSLEARARLVDGVLRFWSGAALDATARLERAYELACDERLGSTATSAGGGSPPRWQRRAATPTPTRCVGRCSCAPGRAATRPSRAPPVPCSPTRPAGAGIVTAPRSTPRGPRRRRRAGAGRARRPRRRLPRQRAPGARRRARRRLRRRRHRRLGRAAEAHLERSGVDPDVVVVARVAHDGTGRARPRPHRDAAP